MDKVVLTGAEREALLSLKTTSAMQERTQNRLSTGLKISSAIDGPEAFFQAKSLSDRTQDFLERMDGIEQAIGLITAAQTALDGITTILQQMKGIVTASAVPSSADPDQFDEMLNQLNRLVDDAYYQGTNLLGNQSTAGQPVTTATHTVEFSEKSDSKVDINGQFAGSTYYLSTGGDAKLIPDATGGSVTLSGSTGTSFDAVGSETQVNTTTTGDQSDSLQYGHQVAGLSDGGYVVVWKDASAADTALGGGGKGVYFQRFDADGNKVGSETVVPANIANDQHYPDVTGLEGGGFVISWADDSNSLDDSGTAIRAQVFDADGNKSGAEIQINDNDGTADETGNQYSPVVTALTGGGFAVAWEGQSAGDSYGINARVFSATGSPVGNQFQVNTTTASNQGFVHITGLEDGGFLVSFADDGGLDGGGWGVFARQFDAGGNATTGQFQVNTATAGTQDDPAAAGLSDGSYVVIWADANAGDGNGSGVKARRYGSTGTALTAEFVVNTTTAGNQGHADIIAMADGGYVITWTDTNGADGNGEGVFAQRYDANNAAVGGEFRINTTTANNQHASKLATVQNGQGFVAVWGDSARDGSGQGVFSQRFGASLTAGILSGANVTSTNYSNNSVTLTLGGKTQSLTVTKQGLGVANAWYYQDFDTVAGREEALSDLNTALTTVRSLSSRLGGQVSLLQVRSDFTHQYSNDLKAGADKLVLADINQEGANMLALQTRQSLGMQALNFLGKAANGILGLFR
ncbi:MAG: hypothetical protein HQL35_00760 [Alphaproteobacteria bacterium]|nr:hypothetical protein [Alphaproteobacteria bacterium]